MLKLTAKRTKWFVFPQDESGEAQVEIVHLKPGDVAEIDAQANRIIGKQREKGFETEVDFNYRLRTELLVQRSIVNWKGFQNAKGKTLKCTDANKLEPMREFDWFVDQVEAFRAELADEVAKEMEGAEKN